MNESDEAAQAKVGSPTNLADSPVALAVRSTVLEVDEGNTQTIPSPTPTKLQRVSNDNDDIYLPGFASIGVDQSCSTLSTIAPILYPPTRRACQPVSCLYMLPACFMLTSMRFACSFFICLSSLCVVSSFLHQLWARQANGSALK